MKNRRVRIGLILLGVLVAALILNGVIRETIAPALLAWVWRVSLMSRGFPQVIVWAIFIALIPILAVFSLIQGQAAEEPEPEPPPEPMHGRVQAWYRNLARLPEGDYFRERAVRNIANLALDTLAYEERLNREEVVKRLRDGSLSVPEVVRQFMHQGLRSHRYSHTPALAGGNGQPPEPETQIEQVIQYLEAELEVKRER